MKYNSRNVLIVGVGFSGMRFARIVKAEGFGVTLLRHRKNLQIPAGFDCTDEYTPSNYSGVIVSTPSDTHYRYARQSIEEHVPTFVDKPLCDSLAEANALLTKAVRTKTILRCGFNLRFLPVVQTVKSWMSEKRLGTLLTADFSVGQYLPFWRPGRGFRNTYSAHYERGGGVSLDLIHELDMALELLGPVRLNPFVSSRLSNLDISVEDFVLYVHRGNPVVTVRADYLSHIYRRRYEIVGSEGSVSCDIAGKRCVFADKSGKTETITNPAQFDISQTYVTEIRSFMKDIHHNSFTTNKRVLGIDALAIALKGRRYVKN